MGRRFGKGTIELEQPDVKGRICEVIDMSTRKEIVSGFYGQYDEDGRTIRSRHGQLEYCTTMAYIHRYATTQSKILEVGAGTGRYSIALAREGMDVTAVELVNSNPKILKDNSKGMVSSV